MADAVVNREHQHAQHQCNGCRYGQSSAFAPAALTRTGRGFDLSFVNNFQSRLIEIAPFVSVRIEEETLGATFHRRISCQSFLKGFERKRPVFFRIELTFGSSFFGSSARFVSETEGGFFEEVLTGAVAGCLTATGLASSSFGCTASGVGSGVGMVTGAVLKMLGATGGGSGVRRWVVT